MARFFAVVALPLVVLLVLLAAPAMAKEAYKALIPNADNVRLNGVSWPAVGHTTASATSSSNNPFGTDFQKYSFSWSAVCTLDSDGDGRTNGEELGDPKCAWTQGATPARVVNITHPGYKDSATSTTTAAGSNGSAEAAGGSWTLLVAVVMLVSVFLTAE
eukprot:GGOE01045953.1.p2 GENE.GGOE01045953.1~~GGOE01045953.1.p2  ORF type:complete len:170 (-),score=43.55 GGOE01045953.1:416-895(-)